MHTVPVTCLDLAMNIDTDADMVLKEQSINQSINK